MALCSPRGSNPDNNGLIKPLKINHLREQTTINKEDKFNFYWTADLNVTDRASMISLTGILSVF